MGKRCGMLYFGSNTKMSKTDGETRSFLRALVEKTRHLWERNIQMFVIPSYTALGDAHRILKNSPIHLGAQNLCYAERGQFTGEVSPLSLRENGVAIAEIGHSERRHVFFETNGMAAGKVNAALKNGMKALLCIGETAHDKAVDIGDEVLRIQIKEGLSGVCAEDIQNVWLAYEPVWAIGEQGVPADPEYIRARHRGVKAVLSALYGEELGMDIPVLYGGSVNAGNACAIIATDCVDGLFVGRAAWTAEGYSGLAGLALEEFNRRKERSE